MIHEYEGLSNTKTLVYKTTRLNFITLENSHVSMIYTVEQRSRCKLIYQDCVLQCSALSANLFHFKLKKRQEVLQAQH